MLTFHRGLLLESQEQARRSDPIVVSVVAFNKQRAQEITLGPLNHLRR